MRCVHFIHPFLAPALSACFIKLSRLNLRYWKILVQVSLYDEAKLQGKNKLNAHKIGEFSCVLF